MKGFMKGFQRFVREDDGVTMVEYGLIAALIAVVCVVSVSLIGTELNKVFDHIQLCLKDVANC